MANPTISNTAADTLKSIHNDCVHIWELWCLARSIVENKAAQGISCTQGPISSFFNTVLNTLEHQVILGLWRLTDRKQTTCNLSRLRKEFGESWPTEINEAYDQIVQMTRDSSDLAKYRNTIIAHRNWKVRTGRSTTNRIPVENINLLFKQLHDIVHACSNVNDTYFFFWIDVSKTDATAFIQHVELLNRVWIAARESACSSEIFTKARQVNL